MKKYIIIAGVNGAGKSTLYNVLDSLQDMKRINTDEIVRGFGNWRNSSDVLKAGKQAVKLIKEYFSKNITFNQETTLCGKSIIRNIEIAKSLGYTIEMHYVGVNSAETAKSRIVHRVKSGGHGIPDADVERRYEESFINLRLVIPLCDMVVLYDNTESFNRFAVYKSGKLFRLSEAVPEWYKRIYSR